MTKNSLDLWSESFLNKHKIFPPPAPPRPKELKKRYLIMKASYSKLVLPLQKEMFYNKKQPIQK